VSLVQELRALLRSKRGFCKLVLNTALLMQD